MAFNFPPGPNYTNIQSQLLFTADIVELASNLLLACPISTINFILIFKTSIIHPNLKLILLCQSLCIFIRGIGRIILNIARIYLQDYSTFGPPLLVIIYMQSINFRNCIMHVMVIERIIATLKSKNYEKNRNILFSVIWITITITISFLNTRTLSSSSLSQKITITTFFILLIFGLFEIWTFFWILSKNKKRYDKELEKSEHNLSERYQLSENIRTAKQLIPCILMHLVCIIIPGIHNCTIYANIFTDHFTVVFVSQCVFTFITIGSFLIELFMIIFHPLLKRDLLSMLCCFRVFSPNIVDPVNYDKEVTPTSRTTKRPFKTYQPMDINGKPLLAIEKNENLGGAYFKQLAVLWQ